MHPWQERFPRLWAAGEAAYVLIFASLAFWILSLPVVTLPVAVVGLLATAGDLGRGRMPGVVTGYWEAARRCGWPATVLGATSAALGAFLYTGARLLLAQPAPLMRLSGWLWAGLLWVWALANVFAWPLLAWYPQGWRSAATRGFLLAAAHPLWGAATLLAAGATLFLLALVPPVLVLAGPGLLAAVVGFGTWRAMRRYAPPDDPVLELGVGGGSAGEGAAGDAAAGEGAVGVGSAAAGPPGASEPPWAGRVSAGTGGAKEEGAGAPS